MNKDKWLVNTLLGLLCGSLGFGASQMTIASEVKVHTAEISQLKEQQKVDRVSFDERMKLVVGLLEKNTELQTAVINQTHDLIALIKVQQQINSK